MLVFPLAAIMEKNKLANDSPFLILIKLEKDEFESPIYLVRNNENITWDGNEYIAFPMQIGNVTFDGKTLPTVDISLSNVGGILQRYIQQYRGFTDAKMTLYCVHASMIDNTTPLIKLEFSVTSTSYNEQWIILHLGCSSESFNYFPQCTYLAHYCPFRFKDIRCGYNGTESACNNTLETCRIKSRFGGEEGMTSGS